MKRLLISALAISVFTAAGSASASSDLFKSLKDAATKAVEQTTNSESSSSSQLGISEITEGLKEALKVGTERVVGQIGADGGYENDPDIHIPLPEAMQKAQSYLRQFGLSGMADEVESKLNEGAEAAAPKAKELIWKAITEMTLEDAQKIYDGPDDAATQYFRKVSTDDLMETVRPVIDQSLEDVGAIAAYDNLIGEYKKYPFVPNIQADLTEHATELALEGLFHYLAKEEAEIRNNPVARTTDILKSVFGGA
ncbi:DUF4197 family protein [Sneathiella sp. P13V-1]|uniref:DUF4197 domain-containing protein n=1 Tax=Sneathiella sp. P13V-1 TaxID=2697366 RepID=UPI00187B25D9|nr:DUF4197 domain-containing protein [Sneathiella sp. P13V-1]MBE7637757.1 DUF4197 family protein [Sneathiella sp. P13V-1]